MLYIYLVILLIYALVFMVKDYEKNIQLNILEIIFICVATVFAPNLITLAAFGTGRMAYSIGAMIGLIILYLYCNLKRNRKNSKIKGNNILYYINFIYNYIFRKFYINYV